MKKYTLKENALTAEDAKWYEAAWNGELKTTGDLLVCEADGGKTEYVVFTGKHTPYGCVRDCGTHYIHATFNGYVRIDKDTMQGNRTEYDF